MPGSRDHPDGEINRPAGLGGKLRAELEAALKLLFREVACHPANLALECPWTAFAMTVPCDINPVPLESPPPQISDDPVTALRQQTQAGRLALLLPEATVAAGGSCNLEPAFVNAPMFETQTAAIGEVRLGKVTARCAPWPAEPIRPRPARAWAIPRQNAGRVEGLSPGHMKAGVRQINAQFGKKGVQSTNRFHLMAIRKSPIPPHRFTPDQRDRFRRALADKGQTLPANVQLKMVYARMDMTLYSSMQQDEHGVLLCVPKPEAVGKQARGGGRAPLAYLVFGNRLDNQQGLRALVPIETPGGDA